MGNLLEVLIIKQFKSQTLFLFICETVESLKKSFYNNRFVISL